MEKTCILCPAKIPVRDYQKKLCFPCYKEYSHYMNEPWFLELEVMQKRQDAIDLRELELIEIAHDTNITGKHEHHVRSPTRSGRLVTDWRLEQKVLDLFDESLENGKRISLRAISKALDYKVKYVTVRRILLDYRKEQFLKKVQKDM